jgi:hypothetical protein
MRRPSAVAVTRPQSRRQVRWLDRWLAALLAPCTRRTAPSPGEVLLELAADAIEESGATREQPLESEGIRKRHLPEDRAHTKAQHRKAE